jgi:hypothetical protein
MSGAMDNVTAFTRWLAVSDDVVVDTASFAGCEGVIICTGETGGITGVAGVLDTEVSLELDAVAVVCDVVEEEELDSSLTSLFVLPSRTT